MCFSAVIIFNKRQMETFNEMHGTLTGTRKAVHTDKYKPGESNGNSNLLVSIRFR